MLTHSAIAYISEIDFVLHALYWFSIFLAISSGLGVFIPVKILNFLGKYV